MSTGTGPVVFESIGSDGYLGFPDVGTGSDYADDSSSLDFTPALGKSFTFAQIMNLTATYSFMEGNCHGGSLRWSIEFANGGHIFIYYGNDNSENPIGTDCTSSGSATNQSGLNMINAAYDSVADTRYETGASGGAYVTYSDALNYAANQGAVTDIILVVDSGWQPLWTDYNGVSHSSGDQKINLTSAQIQTSLGTDTFTPPSTTPTQTCTLPAAQIQVTKTSGSNSGMVNNMLSVSAADTTGYFRMVDCKYMYNLDASTLLGAGSYSVSAWINGYPAMNPATFQLK